MKTFLLLAAIYTLIIYKSYRKNPPIVKHKPTIQGFTGVSTKSGVYKTGFIYELTASPVFYTYYQRISKAN